MQKKEKIQVLWSEISVLKIKNEDYICLTDIIKMKDWNFFISDWLRNRNTVEFLSIWEEVYNSNFNYGECAIIKSKSWLNNFKISAKEWSTKANAIWIISKAWRYWGTYAHKDIAFEFGMRISPKFKKYLIKEFQRLKENENKSLEWSVKRELIKINYKLQTDSIKNYLLPSVEEFKKKYIYSDKADLLNIILFWKTTKDWRDENKDKKWNIRDYATIEQLLLLANLESLNWEFIKQWLEKEKRYELLSNIAINQMKILFWSWKRLEKLDKK